MLRGHGRDIALRSYWHDKMIQICKFTIWGEVNMQNCEFCHFEGILNLVNTTFSFKWTSCTVVTIPSKWRNSEKDVGSRQSNNFLQRYELHRWYFFKMSKSENWSFFFTIYFWKLALPKGIETYLASSVMWSKGTCKVK